MSHLNNDKNSDGIKMDAPKEPEVESPIIDLPRNKILELEAEVKQKDETIVQLTAMCYTLARRLRNESFNDTITSVQRQQMAEMAMQSLNMTADVWVLVHRSEEQQQQNSSS
jgi:hypothetical protein